MSDEAKRLAAALCERFGADYTDRSRREVMNWPRDWLPIAQVALDWTRAEAARVTDHPRVPAETFPPGIFLAEEMEARGWTSRDVARRMGETEESKIALDELVVDLILHVHDKGARVGDDTAKKLGLAFGVEPQFFLNLEAAWLSHGVTDHSARDWINDGRY